MYDPQFWIDPAVYPFLALWGLSTGYEINTNEPHSLLYNIICYGSLRCSELRAEDKATSLSRAEAEQLVNDLKGHIGNESIIYAPDYFPTIKLDEDFATKIFLPTVEQRGEYEVEWEQMGIYHKINKVVRKVQTSQKVGELFTGQIMCRNHVILLIKELEYEEVMAPFAITHNILKKRGSISITWTNKIIDHYPLAEAVLTREKARHVPGNWRIYEDVTPVARKTEFLPAEFVRCEGWLWLRVCHPNKAFTGAEYWEEGFYDDLGKLKADLIEIEHQDMTALCAIYACAYHEPLPEPEPEPEEPPIPTIIAKQMLEMQRQLGVLEALHGALKSEIEDNLKTFDRMLSTSGAPGWELKDEWMRGCRSGMAITLDILTAKVQGVAIDPEFPERSIRITYAEGVEPGARHVQDELIITESNEEDHGTGET